MHFISQGNGVKRTVFSLQDLQTKFEQVEVVSVVQCAGNRGEDFHGVIFFIVVFAKKVLKGIGAGPSKATFLAPHWSGGAIGNAKWTGVRIRDLLKCALFCFLTSRALLMIASYRHCGMDVDGMAEGRVHLKNGQHLNMVSYDVDETGEEYGASTYIDKVAFTLFLT